MPTYFTPIPESPNQIADADTFNDPMTQLDAGIGIAYARGDDALSIATANNSELVAARSSSSDTSRVWSVPARSSSTRRGLMS